MMGWESVTILNKVVFPSKERVDQEMNDTTPQTLIENRQPRISIQTSRTQTRNYSGVVKSSA